MEIPLINLKRQYEELENEINDIVKNVLSSSKYIMGPNVKAFEGTFAEYTGCKYSISCANGTDALVLSLHALGIGAGDEVITTPFTFFATAEAISRVGAKPVFVDVKKDTYNIDTRLIEEKISSKTKALLPVHIFGQPAEMDDICQLAEKYNLYVIEDACQAVGSLYKDKKVGNIGDLGCFSFFPTKNLGAYGDGGIITTNDERLFLLLTALREHGGGQAGEKAYNIINEIVEQNNTDDFSNNCFNMKKYYNYFIGYNSRLDELQASILNVKIKYLDKWNRLRRDHAKYYNENLNSCSLILPSESESVISVYNLYVAQSENRDELVTYLKEKGISTGIYYTVPLHLQKAFEPLGYKKGDLENSEYLSKRTLALPVYPELTRDEQDYIIECILNFERRY